MFGKISLLVFLVFFMGFSNIVYSQDIILNLELIDEEEFFEKFGYKIKHIKTSEDLDFNSYVFGDDFKISLKEAIIKDTTGELSNLVDSFINQDDRNLRLKMVDKIIFKWFGIENIAPNSRVLNFDTRKLLVIEMVTDENFDDIFPKDKPKNLGKEDILYFNYRYNYIRDMVYGFLMKSSRLYYLFEDTNKNYDFAYKHIQPKMDEVVDIIKKQYNKDKKKARETILDVGKISLVDKGFSKLGFNILRESFSDDDNFLIDIEHIDNVVFSEKDKDKFMDYINFGIRLEDKDNIIETGDGINIIYGGNGKDIIRTNDGGDTIRASVGDDEIYSDMGPDIINGGQGDDKIYAGIGDDIIYAGKGNDYIEGGDGCDIYIFGKGDGVDTIKELLFPYNEKNKALIKSSGSNTIKFKDDIKPEDVEIISVSPSKKEIRLKATEDKIVLLCPFNDNHFGIDYLVFKNGVSFFY